MNKRPGQVEVTTEVGYCPSCGRTRNLRREEHHLGTLVRTIVSCETCHRTLSSSIGVATPEPAKVEAQPAPAPAPVREEAPAAKAPAHNVPAKTRAEATPKKTAPARSAAGKPAAKKPAAKKPARGGKPASTATRKVTRRK